MSIATQGNQINAQDINRTFNVGTLEDILDGTELPSVAGEAILSDTNVIFVSSDGVTWDQRLDLSAILRDTNIGKLTDSAGTIKQIGSGIGYRTQITPAQNDHMYFYFIADGTETKVNLSIYTGTDCGEFLLFFNNEYILDPAIVEGYSASPGILNVLADVTGLVVRGKNILDLKITLKHASSTNYRVNVVGINLQ